MFDDYSEFGEMVDECEIEIEHERYSATAEKDAHGNTRPGYLPPVRVRVWGWEPPISDEPFVEQHPDRVVINMLLYAPRFAGPRDRVLLAGDRFEVIGTAGDPNHNPWFQPGLVTYRLKRVEG